MVSCNQAMLRLFDITTDIAASNAPVYLSGESGTGKELFATAIHAMSQRNSQPMITINCGSMPEQLLEGEIFGVRRGGGYSGTAENRPGRLEACYGGTMFLNEVGDLPLPLQTKLLRVIENQEFQPLGGRLPIKTDIRFISSSHRNLEKMVAEGTFRQDLFFRLNTVTLSIPPLRERKEDIPLLLKLALERFNKVYNKQIRAVDQESLQLLCSHSFPGNVRELLNIVEQAVIICRGGEIRKEHLPNSLQTEHKKGVSRTQRSRKMPSAAEFSALFNQLDGNRNEMAKQLNVDRTTIWRWMKRLGFDHQLK